MKDAHTYTYRMHEDARIRLCAVHRATRRTRRVLAVIVGTALAILALSLTR